MKRVYFHEFNVALDKSVWFPVSTGCLQAYALTYEKIRANYEFMPFRFIKKPLRKIDSYHSPSVAAFSCSMWNARFNLMVAERIKKEFPQCLIVFGGVHIPPDPNFLVQHPFVDIAVNGEGEQIFADILLRHLESSDFSEIPSISWRKNGQAIRNTGEPPFIKDLDRYPIPYISGVFDYLLDSDFNFQAIIETNRGCPFKCSFCYWGEGLMKLGKKYRFFGLDNLRKLADWCGQKEIYYVFCADSNFGTFKRDKEIAEYFVSAKRAYKTPDKFRVCYAKNAPSRVFEVAKIFHEADMEKAITLSSQSNSEIVLINIDRANTKSSAYSELAKQATFADIPVYSELILGLPGETYESFVAGVDKILEQSINVQIMMYLCSVLKNTMMDQPEYRKTHGIQTVIVPLTEQHCKIHDADEVKEIDEIIVSTNSMSVDQWEKTTMFSWFFQLIYSLRIGIFVSLYLQFKCKQKPTKFVEFIIEHSKGKSIKSVLDLFRRTSDGILNGQPRDVVMEGSSIYWPVEEVAFIMVSENKDAFYTEFQELLLQYLEMCGIQANLNEVSEVIAYQKCRIVSRSESNSIQLSMNVPEYFEKLCRYNTNAVLNYSPCSIKSEVSSCPSRHEFALKALVYGRKGDGMLGDLHIDHELTDIEVG